NRCHLRRSERWEERPARLESPRGSRIMAIRPLAQMECLREATLERSQGRLNSRLQRKQSAGSQERMHGAGNVKRPAPVFFPRRFKAPGLQETLQAHPRPV